MRKIIIVCAIILFGFIISYDTEPNRCSLCDDLPRHGLCVLDISTGEKLELDIYDPHPFLVGEIAEDQPGGYFTFIRNNDISGYKIAAKCIVITVPNKHTQLAKQYFCQSCRALISSVANNSYVLIDLMDLHSPVVFPISSSSAFSVRCYEVSVHEYTENNTYEITVSGHLPELIQTNK